MFIAVLAPDQTYVKTSPVSDGMTHFLLFGMVEGKIREMFRSKAVCLVCRAECRGLLAALTAFAPIYSSSIELSTRILYVTV